MPIKEVNTDKKPQVTARSVHNNAQGLVHRIKTMRSATMQFLVDIEDSVDVDMSSEYGLDILEQIEQFLIELQEFNEWESLLLRQLRDKLTIVADDHVQKRANTYKRLRQPFQTQ